MNVNPEIFAAHAARTGGEQDRAKQVLRPEGARAILGEVLRNESQSSWSLREKDHLARAEGPDYCGCAARGEADANETMPENNDVGLAVRSPCARMEPDVGADDLRG